MATRNRKSSSGVYPRVCGGTRSPLRPEATGGGLSRVCGGTAFSKLNIASGVGLSPRVRGNPSPPSSRGSGRGSIPACAGEPRRGTLTVKPGRVYPRVCGGTEAASNAERLQAGLSPRVRGNPVHAAVVGQMLRSIPACAGEPPPAPLAGNAPEVYPRVCGGTPAGATCRQCAGGLSRVCGGTYAGFPGPIIPQGLSPRVRGNRAGAGSADAGGGSIPACAGEPPMSRAAPAPAWVYPRVCGGTAPLLPLESQRRGLSPRVRGNLRRRRGTSGKSRSIPACAGEPRQTFPARRLRQVYPRVCGGTHGAQD